MGERTEFFLKVRRRLPRQCKFCHGEEPDSAGKEPRITGSETHQSKQPKSSPHHGDPARGGARATDLEVHRTVENEAGGPFLGGR